MVQESTVFVIDDDPAMRSSLRWLLESEGLAVETFATGEDFLRECDPDRTGCLVLDVRMPGIGGLGVQSELQSRGISWPVIIITGYADATTESRARAAGAHAFLKKPFDDELLLDVVARAIEADRRRVVP
ncbi:MAG: response regulator transcription factor [Thermodesulfobacteriota bacterium]